MCIPMPADGFVVESVGTTIGPGEDVQYCEILTLPGAPTDSIYVARVDGRMTPYSHHLNVMAVAPGSPADQATTPGQRIQCLNNGRTPFGSGLHQIFGSVSPEHSLVLPDGIGLKLQGGQKVIFDYHYFNASPDPVPAKAALAFHVSDAAHVRREIRRFGLYNTGFSVPAGQSASFTAECTMAEDVQVVSLMRHTHRWGHDFNVWHAGGTADGTPVFTSHDYESDIYYAPPPFVLKQGEGFRFECQFQNTTDHPLAFGELATDEMCILYGQLTSTKDGVQALPEDCIILSSSAGQVAQGFACTQCPDGE